MNVYEIREKARLSGRSVFAYDQLAAIAEVPREQARVYASRLVGKRLAQRVVEGVVSFSDDPLVVATQLVEPSYVSMTSALFLRGAITQVPALLECVTPRRSLRLAVPKVNYHRIVPALFFGYERIERSGGYAFVAKLEKAVLDLVYFGGAPPRMDFDLHALRSMSGSYEEHGGPRGRRVTKWVGRL